MSVDLAKLVPTAVYDAYWRFAAKRHAMYLGRLIDPVGPWTDDPILHRYRFTNAYRAADRVSQYLIREVQYGEGRSQGPDEIFFRTLLFKLFNRIQTWELIERETGRVSWQASDLPAINAALETAMQRGARIYSAAYIMPSPALGHARKHANHIALLLRMMEEGLPARIAQAASFAEVYSCLVDYQGIGPFLAFQYAIDLNYSTLTDFEEGSFVVAGPGARDGIAKCFEGGDRLTPEQIIYMMVDRQDAEFARLGLSFAGLFGRRLQPIDCQNLFCEISKYARVAHPEAQGVSGRTRIKQGYRVMTRDIVQPFFPPKWRLSVPVFAALADGSRVDSQGTLF